MNRILSTILLLTTVVALSEASVPIKWPRYIFQPRFTTALDDIRGVIDGKKNKLRRLFDHIDKIIFLKESFEFKSSLLEEYLKDFISEPYICDVEGAELNTANNMCYLLEVVDKKTWPEARQDCLLKGGYLAQPLFKNKTILEFLAALQDGFLEVSEKDLYIGIRAVATGPPPITYKYLNGLILPNDDLSLWFDGTVGEPQKEFVAALAVPVPTEANATTIQFTEVNGTAEEKGYICQFDAVFKPSDAFVTEFFRGSSNDFLNIDVEFPEEKIFNCLGEGQFSMGEKCYKYFDTCLPFLDAKHECHKDGGELAFAPLGPHSRFGGTLADRLADVAGPGTAIWINGEDNDSGRQVVFVVPPSCNSQGHQQDENRDMQELPSPSSSLVLLLPKSTPEDFFDNNEWNIALVGSSIPLPFVCQYKVDH